MSRTPSIVVPSHPTLTDYVFLLLGCSLSLYLWTFSPLRVKATYENGSALFNEFIIFLPKAMRLPEGILLMGPIFYLTQIVRRRPRTLTSLEWLWMLDGMGILLLAGLSIWHRSGTMPEFLAGYAAMPRKLWYLIVVPSLAVLAVILGVAGVMRRSAAAWTHTFALVLLLWPITPLLAIVSLAHFI